MNPPYRRGAARRIVTGLDENGVSRFARIETVEQDYRRELEVGRGITVHRMWAIDGLPVELPSDGLRAPLETAPTADETPEALRWSSPLPGEGGMRASLIEFPPNSSSALHWHDTFDVQWLVAGSITAFLDDGSEIDLRPGDCMIAHGANHGWRVGPEGAVIAAVRLAAKRISPGAAPSQDRATLAPGDVAALRRRTS